MEELKRQRKEQDEGNMTAEAKAKQLEEKLNRQEKIQRKLEEEGSVFRIEIIPSFCFKIKFIRPYRILWAFSNV